MSQPVLPHLELWNILRRRAPRPLLGVLLVAILSYGVASLLPKWYKAQTTLLPPEEMGDSFGMLAGLIEASALSKVGLISSTSASDVFEEILQSRRVREPIVKEFDLQQVYKQKNLDLCLRELDNRVKIEVLRSHVLVLEVEDKSPKMAADLANAMVEGLNRVYRETRTQRAARAREFLAGQMADAQVRLKEAEGKLTSYERLNGVVAGSQREVVSGVADLLARKLSLRVRRTWMESYSGRESPALQSVNTELDAVDREIARLPGLKQEAARLALEVEIQRRVYTLLTAQFEEARLEESRTMSGVSVLDPARPPTIKSRPRKAIIVAVAGGVALLLAGWWIARGARQELDRAGLRVG